jgi:hypothetical protein
MSAPALEFHPAANLFPSLAEDSVEFLGLVASILEHGLHEPITLYNGMVLDGRNRLRACRAAGVAPRFTPFNETAMTPLEFVMARNLHRRHLTVGQRALLAAEMVTTTHGDARRFKQGKDNNNSSDVAPKPSKEVGDKITIAKAAARWSVSPSSVERAGNVIAKAPPSIVAQVRTGKTELGLADTIANKKPEEQHAHPLVKYAGRRGPRPQPIVRPATTSMIKTLSDVELYAIVTRELHRINRAAAIEGRQVIITDLQKGLTF